jgi:hypothetical protein
MTKIACLGRQPALPGGKNLWYVTFPINSATNVGFAMSVAQMALLALRKGGYAADGEALLAFAVTVDGVVPVFVALGAKRVAFAPEDLEGIYLNLLKADRAADQSHLAFVVDHVDDRVSHVQLHNVQGPLTVPELPTAAIFFQDVVYTE